MAEYTTVFLSSTAKDLQPWRDAVAEAIGKLAGYHCVRMEDFGPVNMAPAELCRRKVAECDVFVGLVGHLNGSRPEGSDLSYTQIEYEVAKKKRKPRLMFMADEKFLLSANHREPEEAYQRQVRFREQVKRERVVFPFHDPQLLATMAVAALQNHAQQVARKAGSPDRPQRRTAQTPTDLADVERSYLANLVERYRYLGFKGLGISDRVPLRLPLLDMYVPLQARVQTPTGETWTRHMKLAGRLMGDEEAAAMGERLSKPLPVLDLLQEGCGLVVLGDPGSGKTTFLKSLALTLASGLGETVGLGSRLPVLIPLSAYANALAGRRNIGLGKFMSAFLEDRDGTRSLSGLFEQKFARGEVLLLLDGLDEVRGRQRQDLVVRRVEDFYRAHRAAGNKFVLTSRVVGYREVRPTAEGLAEATLVDFDHKEIAAFVQRWTAAIENAAAGETPMAKAEASREQEELLAAVYGNPGLRSLAANPLLLTILAVMKRQGVTLPDRRVELYERCIETLIKDWNLARGLAGRPEKDLDLLDTLRVLRPLALWMHETSPGVGLVKEGDLHRELERIFSERREKDPERAARQFLDDVREHTSLLLDRGGRQYGFLHLTFQEYLAAAALAQQGQQDVAPIVSALAGHVGEAPWREVSLLTTGYLALVQQRDEAAGAVLGELVRQAPGPAGESAILAGEALVDMGKGAVAARCHESVVAALLGTMRDDRKVLALRRAAAGKVLAKIGDPRQDVMTLDGMEFCWVPQGPFLMGSKKGDREADDREIPQREVAVEYDLWVGRYPVTVAQYREYEDETGKRIPDFGQKANEPAAEMSWYEAVDFCRWLTARWRRSGRIGPAWEARLPTEEEWEKSARGGLRIPSRPVVRAIDGLSPQGKEKVNPLPGRRFPWGRTTGLNRANYRQGEGAIGDRSAVGCFPGGASPYGVEEASGNVLEWTSSVSLEPGFGREETPAESPRVMRGGAFFDDLRDVRCSCRRWDFPVYRNVNVGFRVVLSPALL